MRDLLFGVSSPQWCLHEDYREKGAHINCCSSFLFCKTRQHTSWWSPGSTAAVDGRRLPWLAIAANEQQLDVGVRLLYLFIYLFASSLEIWNVTLEENDGQVKSNEAPSTNISTIATSTCLQLTFLDAYLWPYGVGVSGAGWGGGAQWTGPREERLRFDGGKRGERSRRPRSYTSDVIT